MNYNLLPWRQMKAAKWERWCRVLVVSALGVAMLVAGAASVVFYQEQQALSEQQSSLARRLQAVKTRWAKQPRASVVVSVQTPAGLRQLLHLMFAALPLDVCFTSLHVSLAGAHFHGVALNEAALSYFLPTWPVSSFFSSLRLESMNKDDATFQSVFEVAATSASDENTDEN